MPKFTLSYRKPNVAKESENAEKMTLIEIKSQDKTDLDFERLPQPFTLTKSFYGSQQTENKKYRRFRRDSGCRYTLEDGDNHGFSGKMIDETSRECVVVQIDTSSKTAGVLFIDEHFCFTPQYSESQLQKDTSVRNEVYLSGGKDEINNRNNVVTTLGDFIIVLWWIVDREGRSKADPRYDQTKKRKYWWKRVWWRRCRLF